MYSFSVQWYSMLRVLRPPDPLQEFLGPEAPKVPPRVSHGVSPQLENGRNTASTVLFRKRELTEFCAKLAEFYEKLGEFAWPRK